MKKQSSTGFTIIEVVLVLAIAALIFLMVFVALPTLQRNQRDSERKTDAGIVATAVTDYVSANRKAVDGTTTGAQIAAFIDKLSQYNKSTAIIMRSGAQSPSATTFNSGSTSINDQILVVRSATCSGQTTTKGTARQVAVMVYLENKTVYCVTA
jgi:type II secretory pathway component PulJ